MAATTGPSENRARNGETKGVGESQDWPYHVVGQGAADLSSLGATSLTALWRLDVRRPRTCRAACGAGGRFTNGHPNA